MNENNNASLISGHVWTTMRFSDNRVSFVDSTWCAANWNEAKTQITHSRSNQYLLIPPADAMHQFYPQQEANEQLIIRFGLVLNLRLLLILFHYILERN